MKNLFSESELNQLAMVIADEEKMTSGEFRLVIVGRSSGAEHDLPLLFGIFLSCILIALWIEAPRLPNVSQLWLLTGGVVIAFLLAFLGSRSKWISRCLTSLQSQARQVNQRAELEFYREGLSKTKDGTGILIFLSLFEHSAVVLADHGINSKLPQDTWQNVVQQIVDKKLGEPWRVKLEKAIRSCGKHLRTHFPAQADDKNELPNHIVVKEF